MVVVVVTPGGWERMCRERVQLSIEGLSKHWELRELPPLYPPPRMAELVKMCGAAGGGGG